MVILKIPAHEWNAKSTVKTDINAAIHWDDMVQITTEPVVIVHVYV